MPTTVRLPAELQVEAERYARGLGLSLNGIIAVALRDYLDRRRGPLIEAPTSVEPFDTSRQIRPPAHRRGPCPCGSGKRYSQCHGRPGAQGAGA